VVLIGFLFQHLIIAAPIYGGVWLDSQNNYQLITSTKSNDLSGYSFLASGMFDDTINENGWSILNLQTNQSYPDPQTAYAVGYLEGAVTTQRTYEYLMNEYNGRSPYSPQLYQWLQQNFAWLQQMVSQNPGSNYWYHVGLLYQQQMGAYAGYAQYAKPNQQFDFWTYYAANLGGDLFDLCPAIGCIDDNFVEMRHRRSDGHCSVLVKPLTNWTDILMGHTTWGGFSSMTRIYKHYDFPWQMNAYDTTIVPGQHITFSSYPATFQSGDDYYQIAPSSLLVVETTIENNNSSLWQYVVPNTILEWMRINLANRLTDNGGDWVKIFSEYNSGTYNNEWMVLDYKLFTPGSVPPLGTFTVLEQMPGPYIVYADMTSWLIQYGYWASYNRPYFAEIYNISNQWALYYEYGEHYSWNNTARAEIFRRNQSAVVNETSYRQLMIYNNFQYDPISTQDCNFGASGSNAISERGDLTPAVSDCIPTLRPQNEAGIDLKYTNKAGMNGNPGGQLVVTAQSSPTYDQQPPFDWSTSWLSFVPHMGQPNLWKFPYVTYTFNV